MQQQQQPPPQCCGCLSALGALAGWDHRLSGSVKSTALRVFALCEPLFVLEAMWHCQHALSGSSIHPSIHQTFASAAAAATPPITSSLRTAPIMYQPPNAHEFTVYSHARMLPCTNPQTLTNSLSTPHQNVRPTPDTPARTTNT